jgi:hypothetical protein
MLLFCVWGRRAFPLYCWTACFMEESYVKCGSSRKCRKKCYHEFPRVVVRRTSNRKFI